MVTQSSLSGLVCSCQNPTACPSSWTTIPNLSQFLPIEMAWGPLPRLPTKEQQLQKNSNITFIGVAKLQNCKIAKRANHLKENWQIEQTELICQLLSACVSWCGARAGLNESATDVLSNWANSPKGSRQKIKRDFKTNWNFDETEPRVTLNWKNWRPAKSTSKMNP